MQQTLIQQYYTTLVNGFIEKSNSLKNIEHRLLKGELRELFVREILQTILTVQFGIGSGIIVNQKGLQSKQIDIIIYDKRILPPFIIQQHLGVYPIECVSATIEIKSSLNKKDILRSEDNCKFLYEEILNPKSTTDENIFYPTAAVLGFYGVGIKALSNDGSGKRWLQNNIQYLTYICLADRYSWINMENTGWSCKMKDNYRNETKRFISILLDNIHTKAAKKYELVSRQHNDWLSKYLRDQNSIC